MKKQLSIVLMASQRTGWGQYLTETEADRTKSIKGVPYWIPLFRDSTNQANPTFRQLSQPDTMNSPCSPSCSYRNAR